MGDDKSSPLEWGEFSLPPINLHNAPTIMQTEEDLVEQEGDESSPE